MTFECQSQGEPSSLEGPESKRILVVDDDRDLGDSLKDLLEVAGYEVETATSIAAAERIAARFGPDLAILDIRLGVENGLDLVPILKARDPRTVCLIMTAQASTETAVTAIRRGADDYLYKPIDPRGLIGIVDGYARTQRLERERERAIAAMRDSQRRLNSVMGSVADGILTLDEDGNVDSLNPAAESVLDHSRQDLAGLTLDEVLSAREGPERRICGPKARYDVAQLAAGPAVVLEQCRRDGTRVFIELKVSEVMLDDGRAFVAVVRDVTQWRTMQRRLEHASTHDPLTDLPNRILLEDRVKQALVQGDRIDRGVALLFVDLDHFKEVNDSLGHSAGDALLREAARRLRGAVRLSDTVSRLGGDEFVIVTQIDHRDDAAIIAEKVLTRIAEPFHVGDREVLVSASIGISVGPGDGRDPETLLRKADMAMYVAKAAGKNAYRYCGD